MELKEKHCWAQIDISAIKNNYRLIRDTFSRPFYAVVKADAYGHGAPFVAHIYQEMGVFGLCVSSFAEAMQLRNHGITKPILILGYTRPDKAYDLFKNNLTQTVFSLRYARQLNANALYPVDCHIKLDTGMGRLGFDMVNDPEGAMAQIRQLRDMHNLKFSGIFSHFAAADSLDEQRLLYTEKQMELFDMALDAAQRRGFDLKIIHGQNSAGISRKLNGRFNTMRAGIVLYGRQPSDEVILPGLKPAMSLKTIVTHIKTVKPGRHISYGMNWRADEERKIATLAAGYADGVPRILSFIGHSVEINGQTCPVVGNICMDQMMVDITDTSDVKIGDEVLVLGADGQLSMEKTARKTHTIPHELMCAIPKRVPRVYTENGKICRIEYGY